MWRDNKDKLESDILVLSEIQIQKSLDEKYRQGIQDLAKKIVSHYNDCEAVLRDKSNQATVAEALNKTEKQIMDELSGRHTTQ